MIETALRDLATPALRLLRTSSLYETEPVGLLAQPWFMNLVAEVETELDPMPLLEHIKRVERALGRVPTVRNGPRSIDIDILLYGNHILKMGGLEIPHPRYRERRFALAPLAELAPFLRDPVTQQTMFAMLEALRGQTAKPIAAGPVES
jgi:2-amino-4-hydroxy-6-hydroxymethyldihydropteridine diphosphokinase